MKYRVVCYMRIDPEPEDDTLFDSFEEACAETDQAELLQPENIYEIEEVEE